jgi:glutamate racemase
VEFVEAGVTSGPDVQAAAEEYLAPLKAADIDTLILGCTHYPLLAGVLSLVMGEGVTLVSSADETARDVYALLVRNDLQRDPLGPPPLHRFLTTGRPDQFGELGRRFLGPEVQSVEQFSWMVSPA